MKDRKLSRAYVAERCGVKQRALDSVLGPKPQRRPGGSFLILLAQTLGTTPDDLAGSTDDNPKDAA